MALYSLNIFDLSAITTSNPSGFSSVGGEQFFPGYDTVTLVPGSSSQPVAITDWNDATFDDDAGFAQILSGGSTINGIFYPDGTVIEAEYVLTVQDSLGTNYILQFVSLNSDAYNIQGFVVQGALPPFNEPLTVIQAQDEVVSTYAYSTSSPSCFAANARIELASGGWRAAGELSIGDEVRLYGGDLARIALLIHVRAPHRAGGISRPVRIRANALGSQGPHADLVLSPQHRVYLRELAALVPARALTSQPRIGHLPATGTDFRYVHIVLHQHGLLIAEGLPCESFWPGPVALSQMPGHLAARIRAIMGANPPRAAPFLTVQAARKVMQQTTGT